MAVTNNNNSEEEILRNHHPNMLYSNDFGAGRFFRVIHFDESVGFTIQFAPLTKLQVTYSKSQDDISGFEIVKIVSGQEKQKVNLSNFNFAQLRAFLSFISQIDLKGITEKRLKLSDEQLLDNETIKTVKTLLSKSGGADLVETLINEGIITSKDIVNTSFRKRGLQIFKNIIENKDYWKQYANENDVSTISEEKVWQYFFEKNQWIFGYGLDYRYNNILQREAHVSDSELNGSNTVIGDYLMGDKLFTTFVEIKKPSTKLFGKNSNRSNSWKLSNELIDSFTQILEQKASGQIKIEKEQFIDGEPLKQKAFDSKVILIIGNWDELTESNSTLETEIKKKTFELFRRDSRNVEIITFDELYDRAKYIVGESITNG
jgi:hypothetical protein